MYFPFLFGQESDFVVKIKKEDNNWPETKTIMRGWWRFSGGVQSPIHYAITEGERH